ncbi:MAG: protein kinase [Gemmatimonadales bacterium]|nr:protein kinase [Gemmatimonadales bacterium]NIN11880.1 protein kinase [Gemmatimonadales bacterium]NIN50430.1 protein kinase [Gemmatimonadales bacterium]NIP07894.1 protein kinase [Gemmatimonadales bacterium]NIR01918.1 protein kinase [Gemmatimonadales bacterium]
MRDILPRLKASLGDRYAIEREVGQGGMAIVFLAHDPKHDRKVAVKVLRPELASEIGADRFLREIKLAARLTHPHILPLYDSGEAGGLLFYVMPYVEGESLRDRINREKELPLDDTIEITRAVASALDYAHRHNVVHRDIKPENIMIHDGVAMVTDFGIGKALSAAAGGKLTETGIALGTPAYMSPEQASGDAEIDGRSDLYSLACVLYEMLAGEPPFTGRTAQAIIAKRFMSPVTPLRAVRDVPEAVASAVSRALARTPVDRFPTVNEFAEALRSSAIPTAAVAAAQTGRAEQSVAVVPFANMSADPENEYFSDGITEEIINALSKLKGLQVASRTTSFALKGKELDLREIGKKLGVGSVLEGSVRKAGKRLRITTQLVDVANDYHLWSEVYDRELEDVFAIQEEISRAIVDALKVKLVGDTSVPLVVPATENLEAYTLYLKGRFFRNKFTEPDLRISLELYKQALEHDARYGRAYAGIADTWMNLADDWLPPHEAYPKAKEAAEKAAELEPTLEEAHTSLGKIMGWYDWDFAGAERVLRSVIAQNPSYADAHFALGSVLPCLGRADEAVAEMRKALELDPLLDMHSRWLARMLLFARNYDEAIEQSRRTLEINPNYSRVYLDMGNAYLAEGKTDEALGAYRRGHAVEASVVSFNASTARALAAMGKQDEVSRVLAELEAQSEHRYVRGEVVACGYAALGELDQAIAWLEKAYEERSAGLIYLAADPAYDPLRADPRFDKLMTKVGLQPVDMSSKS